MTTMPERYDVIIIGTGAGGGTLAHTLAPSGKRILLLERGRLPPPRDGRTGIPTRSSSTAATSRTTPGTTPTARRSSRRSTTSSAARRSCTAPPCTGCGPRTSASCSTSTASRPRGRCRYDDFEPYYTKAEWLYQVHGNHGEDPTEGHWSKQYPWPAVSHEPRIQQLSDDLDGRRVPPVPRAVRHPARRGRPREEHLHPLHVVRRLPVPRARQVGRRDDRGAPDPRPAERDAARRRRGHAPRDRRHRPHGHRASSCRAAANEETYDGRHRRRRRPARQQRQAPAALGERPAPERARQRLRPGRPELHVPQQQGRRRARRRSCNETVFQKTLGINDFYFGADDYDWPVGNIQMVGKSNAEAMKGEEPKLTKLAPHFSLADVAEHAVDFWLTTEDLPEAGEPGHARRRRQRAPRLPLDERRRGRPPLPRAQAHPEPRRAWPSTTCSTRTSTWT